MNLGCDGTRQVVQVSCSLAAHKLLVGIINPLILTGIWQDVNVNLYINV